MKERQFGSLDIVITRRKLQVHSVLIKKRKACKSTFVDRLSFPENLDDSFHQGRLANSDSGFENTPSDLPNTWKQKEARESLQSPKGPRTDKGSNLLSSMSLCSSQRVSITRGNELPLSPEFPKLKLVKETQTNKEFPTTNNRRGTMQNIIPKTPQLSCSEGELPNPLLQFKIPETPFIPKPSYIPEIPFIPKPPFVPETPPGITPVTPQHKTRLHKNGKTVCTTVPETPLLSISSMPANNFQRHSTHFCSPELKGNNKRQGFLKDLAKRQYVQVVPETPYLKFKSSDELSLYD